MSQQSFQLVEEGRTPDVGSVDPNPRTNDGDARFSEIRALAHGRRSGARRPPPPLWFESACLGGVLGLTLASYLLLDLDLGVRGNLIITIASSALSCAIIAGGLSRVRQGNVLCSLVLSLAALLFAWFACAATGDRLETQPGRDAFELTPS